MLYSNKKLQSIDIQTRWFLPLYIILLSISMIYSKSIEDEFWSGIEIKKKITSKIKLDLGQQIRMKDHWSQFHKTFTNISLTYKGFSIVELSGGYRYIIYKNKEKYRLNFDSKIEINTKYSPSFRIRLEQESELNKEPEKLVIRNKFSFSEPISMRSMPYISYEIFHSLGDGLFSYNQFRIGFGFKYEFVKNQSIKLFYTYEKNLGKKEIIDTNICGLKYGYSF